MSNGSLYIEFGNATAGARARLWPSWTRLYHDLEARQWDRVWDVGQDEDGMFLDTDQRPRYVSREHFQIERIPGRD
jgi:hypothetical protein